MNDTRTIAPRSAPLTGTFRLPGDKSISHRALFFTTLRPGIPIRNLAPGDDVRRTRELVEAAGYPVLEQDGEVVLGAPRPRPDPLEHPVRIDCGNSGTTARLGLGWLSGERGLWKVSGDESLRTRPMGRITAPLASIGAHFRGGGDRLPVSVIAAERLPGDGVREIAVSSAQVHAGLLLAGLRSSAGLRLHRVERMRDHTLRLVRYLGLPVDTAGDHDTVHPLASISDPHSAAPTDRSSDLRLDIPGDVSSAAFLVTAALLLPGSAITIVDVGLNRTRIGFLEAVRAMGGEVRWEIERETWEPVGSIHVRSGGDLLGREYAPSSFDIPGMADEIPLLALLAAHADGPSRITGAGELRAKESDRITQTVRILNRLGLEVAERPDGFEIAGGGRVRGGVRIDPAGDHRLAMLAGVAGLLAESPLDVTDPDVADVSWPGFWRVMTEAEGG